MRDHKETTASYPKDRQARHRIGVKRNLAKKLVTLFSDSRVIISNQKIASYAIEGAMFCMAVILHSTEMDTASHQHLHRVRNNIRHSRELVQTKKQKHPIAYIEKKKAFEQFVGIIAKISRIKEDTFGKRWADSVTAPWLQTMLNTIPPSQSSEYISEENTETALLDEVYEQVAQELDSERSKPDHDRHPAKYALLNLTEYFIFNVHPTYQKTLEIQRNNAASDWALAKKLKKPDEEIQHLKNKLKRLDATCKNCRAMGGERRHESATIKRFLQDILANLDSTHHARTALYPSATFFKDAVAQTATSSTDADNLTEAPGYESFKKRAWDGSHSWERTLITNKRNIPLPSEPKV